MDKKAFKILMIVVCLLLVAAAAVCISLFHQRPAFYDPRADWERIQSGQFVSLFDITSLTEEEFTVWFSDFLVVPDRQFITFDNDTFGSNSGFHDKVFVCDDPCAAAEISGLFEGKELTPTDEDLWNKYFFEPVERVSIENVIGCVCFYFPGDVTYIDVGVGYDGVAFVIDEDLKPQWDVFWGQIKGDCQKDHNEDAYNALVYWNE